MTAVLKRDPFIVPSAPVLKSHPPVAAGWIHEIKFDGWRAQIHKDGRQVTIFSRNGNDITPRFPSLRDAARALPARSTIIDAEIVACDPEGQPDFYALMRRGGRGAGVCAWCFDLLALNGRDLRELALIRRRDRLTKLLVADDDADALRYSAEFPSSTELLGAAESMGLEGIVSKRADQPYRSGRNPGWIKVKCATWRQANRDRWGLFQRKG